VPARVRPAAHVHHREDEIFYVLEGTLEVTCGDQRWAAGPGGLVMLPMGIPHRFEVGADGPARLLQITTPAQFERFAADVGEPAAAPGLPPPARPDVERLLAAADRYGVEILPPPAGG
jgi:quercetin dioxygenase-like cupin family protein